MTLPNIEEYRDLVYTESRETPNSQKSEVISSFLQENLPKIDAALMAFGGEYTSSYFDDLDITSISQALDHVGLEVTQDMQGVENYRYKVTGQEAVRFSSSGKPFDGGNYVPQTYYYGVSNYIHLVEKLCREGKLINHTEVSFQIKNIRKEFDSK
jgi:hypothetical protein